MAERSGKGGGTAEEANAQAKKDGEKNLRKSSAAQSGLGKKGGKKSSRRS
jgi:hypothetical protein